MWLLYSLLLSYRSIQKELREIRLKCITCNSNNIINNETDNVKNSYGANTKHHSSTSTSTSTPSSNLTVYSANDYTPNTPRDNISSANDTSNGHISSSPSVYNTNIDNIISNNFMNSIDPTARIKNSVLDSMKTIITNYSD